MNWADCFNTYSEACEYFGIETPAQLAAEDAYYAALEAEELKEMEAAFGPYAEPVAPKQESIFLGPWDDDVPF